MANSPDIFVALNIFSSDKKRSEKIVENIHTLQEFMLHTKNLTYLLIVAALIGITGFWLFLTDRDEE